MSTSVLAPSGASEDGNAGEGLRSIIDKSVTSTRERGLKAGDKELMVIRDQVLNSIGVDLYNSDVVAGIGLGLMLLLGLVDVDPMFAMFGQSAVGVVGTAIGVLTLLGEGNYPPAFDSEIITTSAA